MTPFHRGLLTGLILGTLGMALLAAYARAATPPLTPAATMTGASLAVSGSALPSQAGDPIIGRGSPRQRSALVGVPSLTNGAETAGGAPLRSGLARWCAPTPKYCIGWGGDAHLGAVRSFTWGDTPYRVRVCRLSTCTTVLVVSYCACPATLIDLSPSSFDDLAPLSRGTIRVRVEGLR